MSHQQLILQSIQTVSPERLQRAICGLTDGSFQVYVTSCDSTRVDGSVMNRDGREYEVSIGRSHMSCECPDFTHRKTTCKHLLALAMQVLRAEGLEDEPNEEPEERPLTLKLGKTRQGFVFAA